MADRFFQKIPAISHRTTPWLLVLLVGAVGWLGYICVRAEGTADWARAQGASYGILFLLAVAGWWIWESSSQNHPGKFKRLLSRDAQTYSQALRSLLRFFAAGIIVVLLSSMRTEHWANNVVAKAVTVGVLNAGCAFIIGSFLGFLFGFPPAPSSSGVSSASHEMVNQGTTGNVVTAAQPPQSAFYNNTNLREISDWLTKVIVGASLVELSKLPGLVERLVHYIIGGLGGDPDFNTYYSSSVVLAILGYFFSCGVLYGYIWTRYEVAATSQTPDVDSAALAAVDGWLNEPPGPADGKKRVAMTDAIKAASEAGRLRIFLEAEKYRTSQAKHAVEDPNERSLHVFQALVEADPQEIFHRNRGQCALALIGKKKDGGTAADDWSRALDLLNDAIRIRAGFRESGWQEYELARALCQIHLDDGYKKSQPSSPEAQHLIRADIDKGNTVSSQQRTIIDVDDVITKWQALNPQPRAVR